MQKEHKKKINISSFLMTYQQDGSPKGLMVLREPSFKETSHILEKIFGIDIRNKFNPGDMNRQEIEALKQEHCEVMSQLISGEITANDLCDRVGVTPPPEGFPPPVYYELLRYVTKTGIVKSDEGEES